MKLNAGHKQLLLPQALFEHAAIPSLHVESGSSCRASGPWEGPLASIPPHLALHCTAGVCWLPHAGGQTLCRIRPESRSSGFPLSHSRSVAQCARLFGWGRNCACCDRPPCRQPPASPARHLGPEQRYLGQQGRNSPGGDRSSRLQRKDAFSSPQMSCPVLMLGVKASQRAGDCR